VHVHRLHLRKVGRGIRGWLIASARHGRRSRGIRGWTSSPVPAHLEAVTGHVNILRGGNMAAIHARATHCPAGHEYTPENTYIIQRKGGATARQCKICTRARAAAQAAAKRSQGARGGDPAAA